MTDHIARMLRREIPEWQYAAASFIRDAHVALVDNRVKDTLHWLDVALKHLRNAD